MPEEIRRLLIAANRLLDEPCEKVKQLLCRRLSPDIVVASADLERFRNMTQYLIASAALQAIEQHAHIRPAEIEREIVPALLPRRQSKIGRQHPQRRIGRARKSKAHIMAKIRRHPTQMFRINRKLRDDVGKVPAIKRHSLFLLVVSGCSPLLRLRMRQTH